MSTAKDGLRQWSATDGFHAYLAKYGGEPAGAEASCSFTTGVGFPCHGSVDPRFRGKGLPHLAVLHHRLHAAREHGCHV